MHLAFCYRKKRREEDGEAANYCIPDRDKSRQNLELVFLPSSLPWIPTSKAHRLTILILKLAVCVRLWRPAKVRMRSERGQLKVHLLEVEQIAIAARHLFLIKEKHFNSGLCPIENYSHHGRVYMLLFLQRYKSFFFHCKKCSNKMTISSPWRIAFHSHGLLLKAVMMGCAWMQNYSHKNCFMSDFFKLFM